MNITVGGVQQVLLHVKIYEVSRTKIRTMGFDFAQVSSGNLNTLFRSGASGLISALTKDSALPGSPPVSGSSTLQFGIVDGGNVFFGVLEALCQSDVAKVLSEPRLVAVSGRPSYFTVGGEFPYAESQGLGTTDTKFKPYGTRVDFVPIVLGQRRDSSGAAPRGERDRQGQCELAGQSRAQGEQGGHRASSCRLGRRWPSPGWCRPAWWPRLAACLGSPTCRTWGPCSAGSTRTRRRSRP